MTTWEDVVCTVSDWVGAAGRTVTDATEVAKNKWKIAENERTIRTALEALGSLLYESRKEGVELNEELVSELITQVDELTSDNEQMMADVDHRRGCKTCDCGARNPDGSVYCNACGKEL